MPFIPQDIRYFGIIAKYFNYEMPGYIFIIALICCAVIGYLFGSFNFGIIISQNKFHDDVRSHGSGNAGMTNMLRTYGKGVAALTFFGDVLKTFAAIIICQFLIGEAGGYIAAVFCIIGHSYPLYFGFKGGKGVAVLAGICITLEPVTVPFLFIIFVAVVAFTKYVSLASIMTALMYPLVIKAFYKATHNPIPSTYGIVMVCVVIIALLIVFLHRENMKRLLNHTENKISFKKK